MNAGEANRILEYLRDQRASMTAFLGELVRAESPSQTPKAQEAAIGLIAGKLNSLDYHTLHMPGKQTGGYLFARPSKRRREQPLQLMVGHCDTVWEIGTIEEMPLEQTRGQMKGPGIFDMKAGLTQMAFALQAIRDLNLKTTLCPIALINSDEEIGSRESMPAIRRLAKIAERAYILEPPLGLEGKLKTARKGLGRFTLLVKGRAAHAGLDPGKGASAIVELSHQIQNLFALNDPQRGITVNVGMIEGGVSPNVVAPQSKAVVDVRVLSLADAEYITHRIHSLKPVLPDTELEIDGAIGRPPMEKTARNRRLWALARTEALKMGLDVEEATAGGGSDGNTTSLYTATLDGLGATGDGAHAAHEFIFVDKLIERTALLTLLLMAPSVG